MRKLLLPLISSLFVNGVCYAQTATSLNLVCQINGEITSLSVNGVNTIPIKDLAMSVLVEKGVLTISDGKSYFSNKMRALVGTDTISGSDEWKQGENDNRKQYIEINRNTGMVRVTKDINFQNPVIILKAEASGNCEKLANKKKF
jgi:hypothetical protein